LLDDDNPTVRDAVKRKLAAYGPSLEDALEESVPDAPQQVRKQAFELQRDYERDQFVELWDEWILQPSDMLKLERGLCLLAAFLGEENAGKEIADRLDDLAEDFQASPYGYDFAELAEFLFEDGPFLGDESRYYHPENSNFLQVLKRERGNPISLACVFILVGQRVGFDVGGCNYPAHFLARAISEDDGKLYLVDCFNGGRIVPAEDLIRHHPLASKEVETVVRQAAPPEVIIARVLRNLENAFGQIHDQEQQKFMKRLWHRMAESEG